MRLDCFSDRVACLLEQYGVTSKVTFLRLNETTSKASHRLYGERQKSDKTYDRITLDAVVEENPGHNVYGRSGGEAQGDLRVTFYGQEFIPEESDRIDWRGVLYEVIQAKRVMPSGTDEQLGFTVVGRKWSE